LYLCAWNVDTVYVVSVKSLMLRYYSKCGCGGYFWQLPDFFNTSRSFLYSVH